MDDVPPENVLALYDEARGPGRGASDAAIAV
jgi:hypothetical protein